jgi:hypothetical protein
MTLVGSLKPNESLTQLVSGLIVVLTFTLAASVASGGGQDGARAALLGAIAANASWGIINAVLYVMDSAFDRNRQIRIGRAIASSSDEVAALAAIRNELDPYLASVTRAEDREQLYRNVRSALTHGRLPRRTAFLRDDIMGAIAVFFLALAATVLRLEWHSLRSLFSTVVPLDPGGATGRASAVSLEARPSEDV